MSIDERKLRTSVFDRLDELLADGPGFLDRPTLERFEIGDQRIRLLAPQQGISNPPELEGSISAMNSLHGPYQDGSPGDGVWEYAYQGTTTRGMNTKLRRAKELNLEIVYLEQIDVNLYVPIYPVRVVGDDPERLRFTLALSTLANLKNPELDTPVEREYRSTITRQRLHQPKFRARVLHAYGERCTVCRLAKDALLDAAHIIADKDDWGVPEVPNGMAMCKIHHAAYDRNLIGITPEYQVQVTDRVLKEKDGPMLLHGLQEMHGVTIAYPSRMVDRPAKERLAQRYAEFRRA